MYDPAGTDTGYEWIELHNISSQSINLSGWTIQIAGTSFKTSATLSGEIPPNTLFLICEPSVLNCDLAVPKLAFQNGGGATDGIQIVNSSNVVIDTVLYDSPNINNLTDESGVVVSNDRTAPTTASAESLGRKTSVDTDNYFNDFVKFSSPTPGEINITTQLPPEEENDELEPTGASPYKTFRVFLAFILILYSARLIHIPNLKKETHGKS